MSNEKSVSLQDVLKVVRARQSDLEAQITQEIGRLAEALGHLSPEDVGYRPAVFALVDTTRLDHLTVELGGVKMLLALLLERFS